MKGQGFIHRSRFAMSGLFAAVRHEASFRTQLVFGVLVISAVVWLAPPPIWAALVVVMVALVLSAELFNTALEHLADGLHPDISPFIKITKDCAAAAVLVLSLAAVAVFALMLTAL